MRVAEAGCRVKALEPERGTRPLLEGPMALLQQIIGVARRLVSDRWSQLQTAGSRGRAMTVRGHPDRAALIDHVRGAEEGLGDHQITSCTQAYVQQIPSWSSAR